MSAGQHFLVGIDQTDPVALIRAGGEMDASTVRGVDEAIDKVIREYERHVVLELGDVTFIDSTGITALVSALRRLNRSRRRLALVCAPGGPVGRALELTGLDHTFECHHSTQDAVSALGGAPLIGR
jgi:anti-anti-sigma factor